MAINNFKLYETNKLEGFTTYSGTGLNSSTIDYLADNSVYSGLVTWSTSAGDVVIQLSSDVNISKAFINYTNMNGNLQYLNSASSWVTINAFSGTFSNNGSVFLSFSTITARTFKLAFTSDGAYVGTNLYSTPVLGELILTNDLIVNNLSATLLYNPNIYIPKMINIGNEIVTIDGKKDFIIKDRRFQAELAYDYCIGNTSTSFGSDITIWQSLIFTKQKFLFWPNANSSYAPNIYGFKAYEVFKCQAQGDIETSFPVDGNLHIISLAISVEECI